MRKNKTIEEQLDLFTSPISKPEPVYSSDEDEEVIKISSFKDNKPVAAIWDYDQDKFVDVPFGEWVDFQVINTNLPHEQLNREFLKRFKV